MELALSFEGLTCTWQVEGKNGGPRKGSAQEQVFETACALATRRELPTTTRIAQLTEMDTGNVSRHLQDLTAQGRLVRGDKMGKEVPYWPPEVLQQ